MKKRIGIYAVLDKHNDLTKRMSEDARYSLTNKIDEADEGNDLNLDDDKQPEDKNPNGVKGGLDLGNADVKNNPAGGPNENPDEADDALDLDSLGGEDDGAQAPPTDDLGGNQPQGDMGQTPPPAEPSTDTTGEPDEEIDVTDFVEKGTELTDKVGEQVQAMSQQIDTLTQKLSSMDQLLGKIQQVEDEIQAMRPPKPIETLKLRSLDSYPYNQGIDDYWKNKEIEVEKLRDFNRVDNQEYVLTNDDVNNFSDIEIKDSLRPNTQSEQPNPEIKTNQQKPSVFNRQRA